MENEHFCGHCCDHFVGTTSADAEFHDICIKKCSDALGPPPGINLKDDKKGFVLHIANA
jgi:hypothetical protein